MRSQRFQDDRLIEELGYNSNQVMEVLTYQYEASQLVRTTERHFPYTPDGNVTGSTCEYLGIDEHGNWARRQCTPTVDEGELQNVLEPFRGRMVTRAFTYY